MSKNVVVTLEIEHVQRGQHLDSSFIFCKEEDKFEDMLDVLFEETQVRDVELSFYSNGKLLGRGSNDPGGWVTQQIEKMIRDTMDEIPFEGAAQTGPKHMWYSDKEEIQAVVKAAYEED